MGSRALSMVMQDPAVTMFNRYHYGVFNSYANMVRDLVKGKTGAERVEAIGNLMALGMLSGVLYPAMSAGLQKLVGEDTVSKIPRGPAAMPTALYKSLFEGESGEFNRLIANNAIISPVLSAGIDALRNTDWAGRPVREPGASAGQQAVQQVENAAQHLVSPYQLGSRMAAEGAHGVGRTMFGQAVGMRDPTEKALAGAQKGKKIQAASARRRTRRPRGVLEQIFAPN
jgi:hypothetical protein